MWIGIDVGGTQVRVAVRRRGTSGMELVAQFPNEVDYEVTFAKLLGAIDQAKELCGHDPLEAVGIGTAGNYDFEKRVITRATNVTQWIGRPFADDVEAHSGARVVVENDTDAAARGEAGLGGAELGDFLFLIQGTGLGGATCTWEEDVARIAPVAEDLRVKYLRPFESDCSGGGILAWSGKRAEELGEVEWALVMGQEYVHLVALCDGMTPTRVVMGGGLALKQAAWIESVWSRVVAVPRLSHIEFAWAGHGEDSGLWGVLDLAQKLTS